MHGTPEGPYRRSTQSTARKTSPMGHMSLLGSPGGMFWVPCLRLDWSIQTKNSRVSISPVGVLSTGHTRGRPGVAGETVDHKGCGGSHIRNLHLLVTLQACVCLSG